MALAPESPVHYCKPLFHSLSLVLSAVVMSSPTFLYRVAVLLSINDPVQQIVSKKGSGIIFKDGCIIVRLGSCL